ncbi:MAG: TolC family protein [Pseudomonadota bacterium]|nr:TolC family protein [Pseudomonadota bacterium]
MLRNLIASISALALAACAAGPDFVAPSVPPPAASPFVSLDVSGATGAGEADANWWRLYRDPTLDTLVADALSANTDVRAAVARLARARAVLREVGAERTPQLGLGGSTQYGRLPSSQSAGGDREAWSVDLGLEVAYEVDLFGRINRGVEAARGDAAAADADIAAVQVLVAAETVRAYSDAASAAERQGVAERVVALLDRSIELTRRRHEVGLANRLDIARIAALRNQRQAEIPSLVAARQAALFRLATLTGRLPRELPAAAGGRNLTLRLDRPIPVGDGAALLSRRPDVRAAERRLSAATARIGVATADLYPRITLGGSLGSSGSGFGDLFGAGPITWLLGPLLSWTVNREPARARIAGAEADTQAALAAFDGTVLRAIEETETALSNYARLLERRYSIQAAHREAQAAVTITRARQREGQIASLELLDAERTFADAEAELALADAAIAEAQITLFRALGGGWQGDRSSLSS